MQIASDLRQDIQLNANLKALRQKINSGIATYSDVDDFSKVLGDAVSKNMGRYIKDGVPSEYLTQFCDECLNPLYRQSQNTSIDASKAVQSIKNKKSGIGMKPVDVKPDESRLEHIKQRFEEATSYDEVAFLTDKNVARSITRGAVTDSIRGNAKAQSNAGLNVLISRSDGSGCCDWCSSVTGTFTSFDALPDGFWGIHRGCGCTIDYKVGKTSSKLSFETKEDGSITKITE